MYTSCNVLSLVLRPLPPPPREAWYTLFVHARKYPQFLRVCKIAYTYCTLVTYTNCACSFHANKGESAAAPGSLLAKAVSCTVSLVKGQSCSRRSRYKMCTKRDKCFCGYQRSFLVNRFVTFSTFEKMTLPRLKSIPAGFYKINCH